MKPLIGSDPEMFIGAEGKVLSAIGLIGGSKEQPKKCHLGALQEDNVLLEFNITPALTLEDFRTNICTVMQQGQTAIDRFQRTIIRGLSSHVYDPEVMATFGDQAFLFGCEPDFNAWTGEENVLPVGEVDPMLRTAGGHLHIGYSHIQGATRATSRRVASMCDYLLGLPSVLMDKDDLRRQLYGKAGAVRFKEYGVEYRTLSNFWIFSDELIVWAYNGAVDAFEKMHMLEGFMDVVPPSDLQAIINGNNKAGARAALQALEIKVA